MSILSLTRNRETYLTRFNSQSMGTLKIEKAVLKNFDNFIQAQYKTSEAKLFTDIAKLERKDNTILDVLQNYANFLHKNGMTTRIVKNYTRRLKSYLNYILEIKLHSEDLRVIKYPKQIHEDRYPLKIEEIKSILFCADIKRQGMYLFMLGSGMPIEETCRLRKRDFTFTDKRYLVRVPASYRKVKRPKITFMSQEAYNILKPYFDKLKDDDLVFGTNPNPKSCAVVETACFDRVRTKAGYDNLVYENSNHHKIGLHSFRAYFITKASKVDHDLAHALAGHSTARYMSEYDRYEITDLLEFYLKAEKYLLVNGVNTESDLEQKLTDLKDKLQKGDQQQVIMSLREILPDIRKANSLLVNYEKLLKDVEERTLDKK